MLHWMNVGLGVEPPNSAGGAASLQPSRAVLTGGPGNDRFGPAEPPAFRTTPADDVVSGGAGTDLLAFTGRRADYAVSRAGSNLSARDQVAGRDGFDTLMDGERLQFADGTLAYDVSGAAGQAYRLYRAAFARTPDIGGLGFQTRALDGGQPIAQISANFIASPEFQTLYGNPSSLSDGLFVFLLYRNVLGRGPEVDGYVFHTGNLRSGLSRADLLVQFSESPENQAAVLPAIQDGIWFV